MRAAVHTAQSALSQVAPIGSGAFSESSSLNMSVSFLLEPYKVLSGLTVYSWHENIDVVC